MVSKKLDGLKPLGERLIYIAHKLYQEKKKLQEYHEIEYKEPTVEDLRKMLFRQINRSRIGPS
jgi:hypothetical protein